MPHTRPSRDADISQIDAIIDTVAKDPTRAEQAKLRLRDTLGLRPYVVWSGSAAAHADSDDDMWDNLPV